MKEKGFANTLVLAVVVVILVVIGWIVYAFLSGTDVFDTRGDLIKRRSTSVFTPTPLSSTQNIVITNRNDYLVTKGILMELNISGNNKIVLLSKPEIVSSHPDYLPGDYKFAARVLSSNGNILGEYGFGDPRIKYCEMGADCQPLDKSDFTLIIPYWKESKSVDIYSGSGLILSVDASILKGD